VSPVFRHGRLRLYLLKLLDEAPRHGYEVIRLLQDRFLGVYAPSPGTIYPRLARLEEEGLVTHDEVDGKKVYRITEKGREEIRGRLDDLAELEEELAESVRDIAREVTQDVRDTVRNLREELTWATRDMRREGRDRAREQAGPQHSGDSGAAAWQGATRQGATSGPADPAGRAGDTASAPGDAAAGAGDEAGQDASAPGGDGSTARRPGAASGQRADEARRLREEARRAREQMRAAFRFEHGTARDWASWQNWPDWAAAWREWQRPGAHQEGGFASPGATPGPPPGGPRGPGGPGGAGLNAGLLRDLERLALDFAGELRTFGWAAEGFGENTVAQLRGILEDALARIRTEVFRAPASRPDEKAGRGGSGQADSGAADPGVTDPGATE
jgi:DNA-binding PadR family transcriptional regulator